MPIILQFLYRLARDRRGAAGVEYGLLLGLVVLVMVIGLNRLGTENTGKWNYVSTQIASGIAQANG